MIDLKKPNKDFSSHLKIENNFRILFSGPYGIGKTYFIEEFFKNGEGKNYNTIKLNPVNYTIGSNQDVFEYIKYDILCNLLGKNIHIDAKEGFKDLENSLFYFLRKPADFLAPLLILLPTVGGQLFSLFEKYKELHDKFLKEHESEEELLKSFDSQFVNQKGGIYEEDIYTKLIIKYLQILKNKDDKENILIIDDIDRIDPEHIFRLFNIFATHFSYETNENKFGFDKVVFVCDINNIRDIFSSRYGSKVDFSGYIDKFFSYDIFNFDNTQTIVDWYISNFINLNIRSSADQSNREYISNSLNEKRPLLKALVGLLIKQGNLNLRKLIKLNTSGFAYEFIEIHLVTTKIYDWQIDLLILIRYLITTYGSIDDLINGLEKASQLTANNLNYLYINLQRTLEAFLPLLQIKNHKLLDKDDYEFKPKIYGAELNHDIRIIYSLKAEQSRRETFYYAQIKGYRDGNSDIIKEVNNLKINIVDMLYDIVRELKNTNSL